MADRTVEGTGRGQQRERLENRAGVDRAGRHREKRGNQCPSSQMPSLKSGLLWKQGTAVPGSVRALHPVSNQAFVIE